jgi:hypothetical protein
MSSEAEKVSVEVPPAYIMTTQSNQQNKAAQIWQNKKKAIVIGSVCAVIIAGLVLTAVLVSVYWVTEAQKAIVKFNYEMKDQNANVDVASDPNANVVTYHVNYADYDITMDIVDDFNQGIQTVKIQSSQGASCFAMPLNFSSAMSPSVLVGPSSMPVNRTGGQLLVIQPTPVTNRAFLTKKAATMCKDLTLYWAFRDCRENAGSHRSRRSFWGDVWDIAKKYIPKAICWMGGWCV